MRGDAVRVRRLDQKTVDAGIDDFTGAAVDAGQHRQPEGHCLQVDDPEPLV